MELQPSYEYLTPGGGAAAAANFFGAANLDLLRNFSANFNGSSPLGGYNTHDLFNNFNFPYAWPDFRWYEESLRKDAEFRRKMAECFHDDTSTNHSMTAEGEALKKMKAISYGVVLTVICSFGIVGNLLNLIVLTRQRFKAIMYIYLRWMAFADLNAAFFVIIYIIRNGWGVLMTNLTAAYYYAHFAVPIINMFLVTSSIMVVIVTVERYLSTCHPIKSRQLVTPFRAKMTALFAYVLSFFLYIPMAFEFRVTALESVVMDEATGFPLSNQTVTVFAPCYYKEFADSYVYAKVYKTIQVTITKFIPIATISILNTLTLVEFRKIIKRHHALTNKTKKEKKQFDEEYRLTVMLICVVLVYILCLVPNTLAWLIRTSDKQKEFSFQVFIIITDLLEVTNSSLNFYMYCMASADFRKHFRTTFCPGLVRRAGGCSGSRYASEYRSEMDSCVVVTNNSMAAAAATATAYKCLPMTELGPAARHPGSTSAAPGILRVNGSSGGREDRSLLLLPEDDVAAADASSPPVAAAAASRPAPGSPDEMSSGGSTGCSGGSKQELQEAIIRNHAVRETSQ